VRPINRIGFLDGFLLGRNLRGQAPLRAGCSLTRVALGSPEGSPGLSVHRRPVQSDTDVAELEACLLV
jgi:hypothetical protein